MLIDKSNIYFCYYFITVIKCHQTDREVNTINDYLDILSTLTSPLAESPVIDYMNKTWRYRNVNQDSSDNESDDDDNEKPFCGYSEDELEVIKLIIVLHIIILCLNTFIY